MIRLIGIIAITLMTYNFFTKEKKVTPDLDVVRFKMSAITRESQKSSKVVDSAPKFADSEAEASQLLEAIDQEETHIAELPDSEEMSEAHVAEDDIESSEVAWDELKIGWQEHLLNVLSDEDPENAEDIYNAYLSENSAYEAEMAKLESRSTADVQTLMGQLESRHEEKLKEILGKHYQEVTDQHQQYNNSIQHSNRSGKYEIGVSL